MASLAFRAGGSVAIAALAGLFVLAPARHDDRSGGYVFATPTAQLRIMSIPVLA